VYGDEGNLCVVVGAVGAVTLGVNVSIKHNGELTLNFYMRCCARSRFIKSGLQNCLSCIILQHLPERYSPPFVLAGLRLCETGYG
jgi:hypothetical protein